MYGEPKVTSRSQTSDAVLEERSDQPGLADSRLAAHQHRLAVAFPRQLPAVGEQGQLDLSPDQRREILGELDGTTQIRRLRHPADSGGPLRASQPYRRQLFEGEESTDQALRGGADLHLSGLCPVLDLRGHFEGFAEDHPLGLALRGHHHRQAGVDAGPQREPRAVIHLPAPIEPGHLFDQRQGRVHRSAGVVFQGPRITEVDLQTVIEARAEMPGVRLDRLLCEGQELLRHVGEGFGVQGLGSRVGVDQVAAQHGDPAPLVAPERLAPARLAGWPLGLGLGHNRLRALRLEPRGDLAPGRSDHPALGQGPGDPLQLQADRPGGVRTRRRLFLQQVIDQIGEIGGNPWIVFADRRLHMAADPDRRLHRRGPEEWRTPGEHFVEQGAEGEEVGAMVHRLAEGLLGRHGAGGTQQGSLDRDGRVAVGHQVFGQAEVEDLGAAVLDQHHVLGLQVPVHDALGMGHGEATAHIPARLDRPQDIQGTLAENGGEILPLHQLHDDPVGPMGGQDIVDLDDGGMVQPGGGAGLAAKSFASPLLLSAAADLFQRNETIESFVIGTIHTTHSSHAEEGIDSVRANALRQLLSCCLHGRQSSQQAALRQAGGPPSRVVSKVFLPTGRYGCLLPHSELCRG